MKALVLLVILLTLGIIFFKYSKDKKLKKLLVSLGTFALIISLAVMGNLTRPVIPIYMAHMVLVLIAWGTLMVYVFKDKYYGWLMISPLVTIGLFLLLERLTGSGHDLIH